VAGGGEANFSAAPFAEARTASAEMTIFGWDWKRTDERQRQQQRQMRGFFAALRMTAENVQWQSNNNGNGQRLLC